MDWLEEKRNEINKIDAGIMELMKERIDLVEKIGEYKKKNDIAVMQPGRVQEIMEKCTSFASENKIEGGLLKELYKLIINYSCEKESEVKQKTDVRQIRICTLGPAGTCHDNAVKNYLKYQKIEDQCEIVYVSDFTDAVKLLSGGSADYIIQNCAHPQVGVLNEKYRKEVFMIDSFIFPTKSMGVIKRKTSACSNTIGIMPAAIHYIEKEKWRSILYETANPLVEQGLLEDKYEYGITFTDAVDRNPDLLELEESFGGPVDTAWIVYGRNKRNIYNEVLGNDMSNYLRGCL